MAAVAMTDDEKLAMEFLAGLVDQKSTGKISLTYLEPGSERERKARKALVRLLREDAPLSSMVRWRIAALFDPDHTAEARELIIKLRRKGKQPNHIRDIEIARDIAGEVAAGCKTEAAIEAAIKRYRASRATVLRAWKNTGVFG